MKFIDIFAGIGGFRQGMESNGHECVFSCELDKNARKSYKALYMQEHVVGSKEYLEEVAATKENAEIFFEDFTDTEGVLKELPEFDVFCGGFPCQPFSRAGRREGFRDKNKGNLFYSIIEVVRVRNPKIVFLENVKGLLTAGENVEVINGDTGAKLIKEEDKGSTFKDILVMFNELDYDVEWQVINSAHFIAHKRERVYIIARKRTKGTNFKRVFPLPEEQMPPIKINEFKENMHSAYRDFKQLIKDKRSISEFQIEGRELIDYKLKQPFRFNRVSPFKNWGLMIEGHCITGKIDHRLDEPFKNKLINIISKTGEFEDKHILSKTEVEKQRYAKAPKEWKSGNKMGRMSFPDKVDKPSRTLTANSSGREMMVIGYIKLNNKNHYINEIIDENENNSKVIIYDNKEYVTKKVKTKDINYRKLTPMEYWKLQGFSEEDFNKAKDAGVADGQLKKRAGNAVTVDVIRAIAGRL